MVADVRSNQRFRIVAMVALGLLLFLYPSQIWSEGTKEAVKFPEREIRLIVPFPAGSAPDSAFRVLTKVAEEKIGKPIVIINRPGGGGTVGLAELIDAEPDGYTIGGTPVAAVTLIAALRDTTYDGPEDFQPIIQTHTPVHVLFVKADSAFQTLEDFVKAARGGKLLKVGGGGKNTLGNMNVALLEREAGIELDYLPYKAGQQAIAVLNGSIDAGVGFATLSSNYVKKGDLRNLAVFSHDKPEGVKAPLAKDAGYDVAQTPYAFVLAPKGTPADRIKTIHDAYKAALESDEFAKFAQGSFTVPQYMGTDELIKKLKASAAAHRETAKQLGWSK